MIAGPNKVNDQRYTIPQPFQLSHQRITEDKKKKVLKEVKEKEMTECTFKPQTNEGRNRKIIKDILDNDERQFKHHYPRNMEEEDEEYQYDYYEDKENGYLANQ